MIYKIHHHASHNVRSAVQLNKHGYSDCPKCTAHTASPQSCRSVLSDIGASMCATGTAATAKNAPTRISCRLGLPLPANNRTTRNALAPTSMDDERGVEGNLSQAYSMPAREAILPVRSPYTLPFFPLICFLSTGTGQGTSPCTSRICASDSESSVPPCRPEQLVPSSFPARFSSVAAPPCPLVQSLSVP